MKSFEDTQRDISALVIDVGGSLDAYEHDAPAPAAPAQVSDFEAALATITAHTQHNDTSSRTSAAPAEVLWEATGKTPATLIKEMGEISEQLGGLTEDPFIEETPKDYPTPEEEIAFFKEMNVPHPNEAEPDPEDPGTMFDGAFWGDVTNLVCLPEQPDPIEDQYELFGLVSKSDELQEIYSAFRFTQQTGEPQTVKLDSGTYEMSPCYDGHGWEIHDTGKERKYAQENVCRFYENVKEEDLFLWVIPDDRSEREDLGYIHNRWVFITKEGPTE